MKNGHKEKWDREKIEFLRDCLIFWYLVSSSWMKNDHKERWDRENIDNTVNTVNTQRILINFIKSRYQLIEIE